MDSKLPALLQTKDRQLNGNQNVIIDSKTLLNYFNKQSKTEVIQTKLLDEISLLRKLNERTAAFNERQAQIISKRIYAEPLKTTQKLADKKEEKNIADETRSLSRSKTDRTRTLAGDIGAFIGGALPAKQFANYLFGAMDMKADQNSYKAGGIEPGSESSKQRDRELLADAIARRLSDLLGGMMGGGSGFGLPDIDLPGRRRPYPVGVPGERGRPNTQPGKTGRGAPSRPLPKWNPALRGGKGGWIDPETGKMMSNKAAQEIIEEAARAGTRSIGGRAVGVLASASVGAAIFGMTPSDTNVGEEENIRARESAKAPGLTQGEEEQLRAELLFEKLPDNVKARLKTGEKTKLVSAGRGQTKKVGTGQMYTAEEIEAQKAQIVKDYLRPDSSGQLSPDKRKLIQDLEAQMPSAIARAVEKKEFESMRADLNKGIYPIARPEDGVEVVGEVEPRAVPVAPAGQQIKETTAENQDLRDQLVQSLTAMGISPLITNTLITNNKQSFVPMKPGVDNDDDAMKRYLDNVVKYFDR